MDMQVSAAREPESAGPRPLDELDRSVVQALQIHPRAPWTLVGEVLGVNPVTAARRWQRLERAGLAWVTAYGRLSDPRIVVTGVVEIDTEPGFGEDVADALGIHPEVVNVKLTAGGRDLVATIQAGGLEALAHFTNELFRATPGVRATRTHVATAVPTEGSRWRLRSLDATQRARLERALPRTAPTRDTRDAPGSATHGPGAHGAGTHVRDELDTRLAELLGADGRMSVPDLAKATGAGFTTVRRRLQTLLSSWLWLRCDLARPLSGWPLSAVYFASVPAQHLDETVRLLSSVPEVRSCSITAGPHNVVLDVWLRTLADVHTFEAHLAQRLPRLTVDDRSVVLRTTKHMGRLLDRDGACVGVVPLPHYADAPTRTP
ncbi:Lrp/AsnC family transcriptional regulator [Streptomyces sp. NPDC050509]|uniref:Lrp/AsnC family transcriptional regulator n=1 Tax=Streptomyces sp. NPDC050509 TaxID=3365620 RepID=UPI0037B3DA02